MTLSLNAGALAVVDAMTRRSEQLRISHRRLEDGARLIDCGAEVAGGLAAGLAFAEASMGGLGHVALTPMEIGERPVLGVSVATDHPAPACLAAQYAGRRLEGDGFFAMASGPGRALIGGEPIFEDLSWREEADVAVLCLETRTVPPAAVRAGIAQRAGVPLEALTLLMAPTASLVGSIQVAARVLETALHKLHELGFDPERVTAGSGSCPIAPVARDDRSAIGRTNDAVLYGGAVQLVADAPDDELVELMVKLPSSASSAYGEPFANILEAAGWDFYAIDPLLFSPAAITISSLVSGRSHHAGARAPAVLERSLWG